MKIVPDVDFISSNFNKTIDLTHKYCIDGLSILLENFSDRYTVCPASSKKEYFSAFPGGLAYHNLFVFFWMKKFAELMYATNFSVESLFKVSILHELGKLGDEKNEYYIPQKSDWHRERGIYYNINPNIQYMKISQRSLYLAHRHDIDLSMDEYLAILLHDGQNDEANKAYKYKEPDLAILLQYASQWAIKKEKDNVIIWP